MNASDEPYDPPVDYPDTSAGFPALHDTSVVNPEHLADCDTQIRPVGGLPAWSAATEAIPTPRSSWKTAAAIGGGLMVAAALLVGTIGLVDIDLTRHSTRTVIETAAPPPPTVTVNVPTPSPTTTTVTEPPPAVAAPPTEAPTTAAPPQTQDDRYIALVNRRLPGDFQVTDRAAAINTGHKVCYHLADGESEDTVLNEMVTSTQPTSGWTPALAQQLAEAVMDSAIAVYCPKYISTPN